MDPINNTISQFHFERKPPYQEEAILRATGKDVEVGYDLKRVEQKVKTVSNKEDVQKLYTPTEKEAKMDNTGPIPPEAVLETLTSLRDKFPEFDTLSDSKKTVFIADLMNGNMDDIIFKNLYIK